MSSDTPTILKNILARKQQEIIERSSVKPIAQLLEQIASASAPRGFATALELSLIHISEPTRPY